MKKTLFAVAVCLILAASGSAVLAEAYGGGYGGRHHGMGGYGGMGMGPVAGGFYRQGHNGGFGFGAPGNIELPKEILDKRVEAEKIAIDLRAELSKRPVNRAKALELHKKHQTLRMAISDWWFQQQLDALK